MKIIITYESNNCCFIAIWISKFMSSVSLFGTPPLRNQKIYNLIKNFISIGWLNREFIAKKRYTIWRNSNLTG